MKIRILSLAASDLAAGRDFYEQQQSGLGQYFLVELWAVHAGNSCLLRGWPI